MKKIKDLWRSLDTQDDRIFILTVSVSILVCLIAIVAGAMRGLTWQA